VEAREREAERGLSARPHTGYGDDPITGTMSVNRLQSPALRRPYLGHSI
jgi:hypothetical protein